MTTQDIVFEKRGHSYGVIHVRASKDGDLVDLASLIMDHLQISICPKHILHLGGVYVDNIREVNPGRAIRKGQYLRIHTQPRRFQKPFKRMKESILFQHSDFYVVNKPPGISTHASVDNLRENLHAWLEQDLEESLYLTSRLDVPTSGLLIYARNKNFQSQFNKFINDHRVRKEYVAAHQGNPLDQGVYQHWMQISPRAPKIVWKEKPKVEPAQQCLLEILNSTYSKNQDYCISEILLLTGRTHQIRSQLSELQRPILGDTLYQGKKKSCWDTNRISLFCKRLQFQDFDFYLPDAHQTLLNATSSS